MILQFGTSRFLQAHVDLFVSEALEPLPGQGPITVVQTTGDAERARRVRAFDAGRFPVHLRGVQGGVVVDRWVEVRSVSRGLSAAGDWPEIVRSFVGHARAVISNTGEHGYDLDPADRADDAPPRSFPAKLLALMHAGYRAGADPLDIYPCELIRANGRVLREAVLSQARAWGLDPAFLAWIGEECRFVNSLVDRIVSAPIEPVGAVAEPYALWAIERQAGLQPICRHPDIVLAESLDDFETRKLFILNLGHTALVELWRERSGPADLTVREAIADPALRQPLDALYEAEVIPVFAALGQEGEARGYLAHTMERFANPFLDHRLRDIAVNHDLKRARRFGGLLRLAREHAPRLRQPWLRRHLPSASDVAVPAPVAPPP